MDFEDHEEGDDMDLTPLGSSYESPRRNSSIGVAGSGARGGAETMGGSGWNRKLSVCGGGRYRECLKNHAVGIGGQAVDGCGEFIAAGEDGTLDALRCAACSCHRNFHRKESNSSCGTELAAPSGGAYNPHFPPYYRMPVAGYLQHHHQMAATAGHYNNQHYRPSAPLALPSTSSGGGGWYNSSRDNRDDVSDPTTAIGVDGGGSGGVWTGMSDGGGSGGAAGKKRFRTRFTEEQKDKMLAFAERMGWRIQKHDEAAVQQFCDETCVERQALRVWMHNNKHTLGKKP